MIDKPDPVTAIPVRNLVLFGWLAPMFIVGICYFIAWRYEMATSQDSFAGFGYFMMAPAFFVGVGLLNLWIMIVRRNIRNIYQAFGIGLIVPLGLFIAFQLL